MPYVSSSSLSAILADLKEKGLPELHQRKHFLEATKEGLASCNRYGPLVQELPVVKLDGSLGHILCTNVLSYLAGLYEQKGSYQELLKQTFAVDPCTIDHPWTMAVYGDEIIPGNVLGRGERKCWAIYCSITNFKLPAPQNESSWIILATLRSSLVAELNGGTSQAWAAILKSIWCNKVCNPAHGLLLPSSAGNLTVYLSLGMVLQDGASHKYTWSAKGDSGWRYCMLCSNVANKQKSQEKGDEAIGMDDEMVEHKLKYSQLQITTDTGLLESFSRLAEKEQTMSKKDFELWQMACGFTFAKHSLLADQTLIRANLLAPASQYCHDWMHCTLSNGCLNIAMFGLLEAMPKTIWTSLGSYIQQWVLPATWRMKHLPSLFTEKRLKKYKEAHKIAVQASKALALAQIFVYFVHSIALPSGSCIGECEAFLCMAKVVELLNTGQNWGLTTTALLLEAIEAALEKSSQVWPQLMSRKFHWLLHLPAELQRFGMLPACFSTERKHKLVTKYAAPIKNTKVFELSLLQEVLSEEMEHLKTTGLFHNGPRLVGPHQCTNKLLEVVKATLGREDLDNSDVSTSTAAKLDLAICHKGDIVLLSTGDAALVCTFVSITNKICAFVVLLKLLEDSPATFSAVWKKDEGKCLLPASEILVPLVYKTTTEGILTLIPWSVKQLLKI